MNSVWIENAYNKIAEQIPYFTFDSLEVAKAVDGHRYYWKPDQVKILLLAESHVYTDNSPSINYSSIDFTKRRLESCPDSYVKLVYCLAYGENCLLGGVNKIENNKGTPQFWKIFSACASDADNIETIKSEFNKILVSTMRDKNERINYKIDLLEKLKEKGIWLLDSSIVALYGYEKNMKKKVDKLKTKVVKICWEPYISKIIQRENPNHIIVIGKGVGGALKNRLKETGIPFEIVSQPQDRNLSTVDRDKIFLKLQQICNNDGPSIILQNSSKESNDKSMLKTKKVMLKEESGKPFSRDPADNIKIEYRDSRLCFKKDLIEPLKLTESFRVKTPEGSFQMTKKEFYETFSNVVQTISYQEKGIYHYPKIPKKAMQFKVD